MDDEIFKLSSLKNSCGNDGENCTLFVDHGVHAPGILALERITVVRMTCGVFVTKISLDRPDICNAPLVSNDNAIELK